jgi:acetyl-CoA acyltransferase
VACRPTSWASARSRPFPAALKYAGLKLDDIGWFELNEAFAAQSLAVMNTCGLDPAKVNPMGGAIALGHPLGATGAIRAATVVHALRRHKLKYGMVTMCVGMGQGAAGIFERHLMHIANHWTERVRS